MRAMRDVGAPTSALHRCPPRRRPRARARARLLGRGVECGCATTRSLDGGRVRASVEGLGWGARVGVCLLGV